MPLGKANQGDTLRVNGTIYMAMIRMRGCWGCRPFLSLADGWGEHVFFNDDTEVEFIERYEKSVKGRRKQAGEVHQLGESKVTGDLGL